MLVYVEDDAQILKENAAYFRMEYGAEVIEASSLEEGKKILVNCRSAASGLITDLRLRESVHDRSGETLAEFARKAVPGMPITSFSGYDVSDEAEGKGLFDFKISKGNPKQFEVEIPKVINAVKAFEAKRSDHYIEKLKTLKAKYQISDADFYEFIRPVPYEATTQLGLEIFHAEMNEEELQDSEDEMEFSLIDHDIDSRLAINLPVVRVKHDDFVSTELFGFPDIFAYGDATLEADKALVELLAGYQKDFEDENKFAEACLSDVRKFRRYLARVIAPASI